jgi:DNA-binding PadR family transcriptional regulator
MNILTRKQEIVLLAVLKAGDNAYGYTIWEEIRRLQGKAPAFGALFVTLERLAQKGLLTSTLSDPTPERGGKSKRMYRLTPEAMKALKKVREFQQSLWEESPELSSDSSGN